jgi:hypothetical protein
MGFSGGTYVGLFGPKNKSSEQKIERRVHLAETIQKIQDGIGAIKGQIDTEIKAIDKTVTKHIEDEDKKLDRILIAANGCPEASHIVLQNGLIAEQKDELKEQGREQVRQGKTQNKILGMMVFCGLLLSFLLFVVFWFAQDNNNKPSSELKMLDEIIYKYIEKEGKNN